MIRVLSGSIVDFWSPTKVKGGVINTGFVVRLWTLTQERKYVRELHSVVVDSEDERFVTGRVEGGGTTVGTE